MSSTELEDIRDLQLKNETILEPENSNPDLPETQGCCIQH